MRTVFALAAVAALAACSDQQQPPTSPRSPDPRLGSSVGPTTDGNKVPQAKPTDQVGFTKVTIYQGTAVNVAPGQTSLVIATCPAGAVRTGGGYDLDQPTGAFPLVLHSRPHQVDNAWVVVIANTAAGAGSVYTRAWVACAS